MVVYRVGEWPHSLGRVVPGYCPEARRNRSRSLDTRWLIVTSGSAESERKPFRSPQAMAPVARKAGQRTRCRTPGAAGLEQDGTCGPCNSTRTSEGISPRWRSPQASFGLRFRATGDLLPPVDDGPSAGEGGAQARARLGSPSLLRVLGLAAILVARANEKLLALRCARRAGESKHRRHTDCDALTEARVP